jgi:predicted dehydrogenase
MNQLRVAVVGAGHLGTYHAEKFYRLSNAQLVAICDPDQDKAKPLADKYQCQAVTDYKEIVEQVEAALIATPTPMHFSIAKEFLQSGKHLLIEKPITTTVDEAKQLCQWAADKRVILQVGHVERFNPALIAAKEKLKEPLFIECHRLAPFKPRSTDVDVVLDLMIHDIDVIMNLINSPVTQVSAVGTPVITPYVDIANARLEFASGAVANITASRVSQSATRKFRVFQETQYLSIDFGTSEVNLTTKTGEWDNFEDELPLDFESWELDKGDALLTEDQAFVKAALNGTPPVVTGEQALLAMEVVEQIRDEINRRLAKR